MRFFYIINNKKQLVDVGKVDSAKGYLMQQLTCDFEKMDLEKFKQYLIIVNIETVKELIDNLLLERNTKPLDWNEEDYNNKFYQEIQLFVEYEYDSKKYVFCKTGFDHQIIFLINIYNSLLKDESPYYIVFANTHKEFEEFQKQSVK